jgi:hypothetical protein
MASVLVENADMGKLVGCYDIIQIFGQPTVISQAHSLPAKPWPAVTTIIQVKY